MSRIDDELDGIVDAQLLYLENAGPAPDLSSLAPELQSKALERIRLLEAFWGARVELPDEDPISKRFGFDRPGQTISLDGRRVAKIRKTRGMDLQALHSLVSDAGGAISLATLFQLEVSAAFDVDQPTASALAAVLDTTMVDVEVVASETPPSALSKFLDGPNFARIINEWATRFNQSAAEVQVTVTRRLRAAQYRADDVTEDQLVEIVTTILDDLKP